MNIRAHLVQDFHGIAPTVAFLLDVEDLCFHGAEDVHSPTTENVEVYPLVN